MAHLGRSPRSFWGWQWLIVLCFMTACHSHPYIEGPSPASISENSFKKDQNGCMNMVNSYCSQLYSPGFSGNLLISRKKPIQILEGDTYNQLSQIYVKYSVAKIRHKNQLPADFLQALNQYSYFDKLDDLLNRKPISAMTVDERLQSEYLEYEISTVWSNALDQAVMLRMNAKYPGYHHITDRLMPIEYDIDAKKIRRQLISDISKVLWRDDKNWQNVMDGFNDLKQSYYRLFERLDLPQEILNDWHKKIESIALVLPGSLPEISDEECSTTTSNAYYYSHLNLITVCAGDFNSGDILLVLAHEMGHALDGKRDFYLFQRNSALGQKMSSFRQTVCSPQPKLNCDDWNSFKSDMSTGRISLSNYQVQLPEFQRCLKRSPTTKKLDVVEARRIADQVSHNRIATMAASDLFLRLVKERLPLKNGQLHHNPSYMNPCGYSTWSKNEESMDDSLYTLVFFTYEYQCSQLKAEDKLRSSIEVTQNLTADLISEILVAQGEFSDRDEVTAEEYASPPYERFADVMGSYAVSEYLKHYENTWDKRSKYLASISWLCQEPSLGSVFPIESEIEKSFSMDSHTEGVDRSKELLMEPIRDSLSCSKDFEFKECSLKFKN